MEQKETFLHFKQGEKNQSPIKQEMSMWWAQRTVTESSCVRCCGNPSSLACTRQPAKAGPCPWEWAAPMMPSRLIKALGWSDILWFQRLKLWFFFQNKNLTFRFTKNNSRDSYCSPLDHSYSYGPYANNVFSLNSMTAVLYHELWNLQSFRVIILNDFNVKDARLTIRLLFSPLTLNCKFHLFIDSSIALSSYL